MQILNHDWTPERIDDRIRTARPRFLILDYDGTLAPFVDDPAEARLYPEIPPLLQQIQSTRDTRILLVSGRAVADLYPLLPKDLTLEIWGCHGMERRKTDGQSRMVGCRDAVLANLRAARKQLEKHLADLSLRIEEKPAALTVHWRGLPGDTVTQIISRATAQLKPYATPETGLVLKPFKQGLELRLKAYDKSRAIRILKTENPPESFLCYLGDDLTDEDAFTAMENQDLGALVNPELRITSADIWLRNKEALLQFLSLWI